MKDTRLLHARQALEGALEILAGLQAERIPDPHDVISVARAEKLTSAAVQAVMAAYEEEVEPCDRRGGWSMGPLD